MTQHAFVITGTRITYHNATVDEIEHAATTKPEDRLRQLLEREPVTEAFVLQTCNRSEMYVVTEKRSQGNYILSDVNTQRQLTKQIEMGHQESLRHLLRVATGLDSQVLGEDQILGQFRTAYQTALEQNAIGPVLEPALLKAIHVGERARSETTINEGVVSLGSAAATLAARETSLDGATAVIVGAGEMAALVASAFATEPIDTLKIINRSPERATKLADSLTIQAEAYGLDELTSHLQDADVVISSTGSESPIIDRPILSNTRETLLIDLAQPRDIDPTVGQLDHITVYDLDGLKTITRKTHEDRQHAAKNVEEIVNDEYELLIQQYKRERADTVISAMYTGADRIKQNEVSRALSHGDFDESEREILNALADSIVSQLMAVPTRSLRDAAANDDWETISTAIDLFDPNLDETGLSAVMNLNDDTTQSIPADATDDE